MLAEGGELPWDGVGDGEVTGAEATSSKSEDLLTVSVVNIGVCGWVVDNVGCNFYDAIAVIVIDEPGVALSGGSGVGCDTEVGLAVVLG